MVTPQPQALVVDDDEPIRSLAAKVLARAGFDVTTVKDGFEAVEVTASRTFHVILLDLMMPRMSGFDVLHHFRSVSPERLQQVIIMTAATGTQLERLENVSVFGMLRKPFDIDELRTTALACVAARMEM